MADQTKADIGEQPDHPGLLEKGAEQDEQENEGRGHIGRDAVDPLGAVSHVVDDLAEIIAAMIERTGQVFAPQAIGEERAGNDRQGRSHHRPCSRKDQCQRQDTDNDVHRQRVARAHQQRHIFPPLVECDTDAGQRSRPGERTDWRLGTAHQREDRETEQHQEADMERPCHLAGKIDQMGCSDDLECRESDRDPEQGAAFQAGREPGSQRIMRIGRRVRRAGICVGHHGLPVWSSGRTLRPAHPVLVFGFT